MASNGVQEEQAAEEAGQAESGEAATNTVHVRRRAPGDDEEGHGGEEDGAIPQTTHCSAAAFHIHEPTLTQLVEEGLEDAINDEEDDDLI